MGSLVVLVLDELEAGHPGPFPDRSVKPLQYAVS